MKINMAYSNCTKNLSSRMFVKVNLLGFVVLLLFISFLSNPSSLFSQTIVKSSPDKVASRFSDYEIIGKNDLGILIHFFGSNESELVAYDNQLRIVNRKELPFKGRGINLEGFLLLKDKVLTFYTTNNENFQFFKLKVLDNKLTIPNETILLDSLPLVNVGNSKAFYVKASPDKSKILLFNIVKTKSSFFVRFTVMDDSLRILKRNIFTLTDVSNVSLKSIKVSNQGSVVAAIGHEGGYDNQDYNFDKYTIFAYNPSTNTISEQMLMSQDAILKNIITEVTNQSGLVYVTACYKSIKDKRDIGLLNQTIDLGANTVLLNSKMPFDEEILQRSQNNEFKTWQDKASLVRPRRIIPRSDGGAIVVTEGEYKFTRVERMPMTNYGYYNTYPATTSARYIEQNHYYDIGIYSINKDGTLDWQSSLPKVQVSENDEGYYSSFAFFESNNVLKFLFNEDFYNIGNFVEYNINPNGLTKRLSVMNSEKQDLVLVPLKAKQLDGQTIIVPSEQKRNLQLVLFQY